MSYNPYRTFSSYWWKHWFILPYDIKWFFMRVWLYRSFLWNDNDFDFGAVLHFMRFKLRRLRRHMEEHASIAHSEDVVAELAKVDVLLRNVIDDDPDDEWSTHYDQWHHNKELNDPCPLSQDECVKTLIVSRERTERNWHELWRYLDANMRNWWD